MGFVLSRPEEPPPMRLSTALLAFATLLAVLSFLLVASQLVST